MIKTNNIRIISFFLCLSMAFFFMPIYSIADAETTPYDGYIVTLKDNSDVEINEKKSDLEEIVEGEIYYAETKQDISEELPTNEIESIDPNYEIDLLDYYNPNDPKYQSSKWQQEMIKVQEVWAQGYTGKGINGAKTPVVAIIDSGIAGSGENPKNPKHEDLNYDNILPGYNACTDYDKDFTDDTKLKKDSELGHGTFVAGIIAAIANNGVGIAGNMPDVKIRPYRCFDKKGKGSVALELKCIYKAIEDGVDVINLSVGGDQYTKQEAEAIFAANRKGIIVCAAVGNNGDSTAFYPAYNDKVIGVGSVNENETKSSFSNYNKSVDVVAPGEKIVGLGIESSKSYISRYGTSFACPQVSALAAMCKSIQPTINHDKFLEILQETSIDLGTSGYDKKYGWGLIDYSRVLEYMLNGEVEPVYNVKIKKIVAGKKQFKVLWDKTVDGTYQMQYSTNSKFSKKSRKTYTVKNKTATGVKVSKLKSKKKYYVRIRAKIKTDEKSFYTNWSAVKSVKTK